jgi:hypothetical protein
MTTPRTIDTLRKQAERAGEKAYEHRRQAALEAAKAIAARQPGTETAGESHADE